MPFLPFLPGGAQPASARGCTVTITSAHAFAHGTVQSVKFASAIFDSSNFFSATASGLITIPSGVSYVKLDGCVRFSANTTGSRQVFFQKNSAAFDGSVICEIPAPDIAFGGGININTGIIPVSEGDTFQMMAQQTTGVTISLLNNETYNWMALTVLQ